MGPFKNLNRPVTGAEHMSLGKWTTIITTNIIAAARNTLKPIHSLSDHNIDNAPQSILAAETLKALSKIPYAVDISFGGEPQNRASFSVHLHK